MNVSRLKAKSASLAGYLMIAGLSAVGVYFATSCWPESPRPAAPAQAPLSGEYRGPSVRAAVEELGKRPGYGSPDDAVE
jgi:hypothetical protein